MENVASFKTCFLQKYMDFSGRASRPEYWWFVLAYVIGTVVLVVLINSYFLSLIYGLVFFLPATAAGARRLQDAGYNGQNDRRFRTLQ